MNFMANQFAFDGKPPEEEKRVPFKKSCQPYLGKMKEDIIFPACRPVTAVILGQILSFITHWLKARLIPVWSWMENALLWWSERTSQSAEHFVARQSQNQVNREAQFDVWIFGNKKLKMGRVWGRDIDFSFAFRCFQRQSASWSFKTIRIEHLCREFHGYFYDVESKAMYEFKLF